MSGASRTREFFENGTSGQFEWVLNLYDEALKLKAENKSSKPENVIKLDKWYQTELPKKIKARGKEAHLIHDELVQTIKWKLARGKFQANMVNLIQMNTPRVVMQETKKAFRNIFKRGNLESAAQALCNLKGVGPTMASAVLAAGAPHLAPFMADECLLAMPDGESLDYTMKEYMRFVEYTQNCVDRLKSQGGDWTPHKVELAVWTHYILNDLKPELLSDLPGRNAPPAQSTASATIKPVTSSAASVSSNGTDQENGASTSDEECGSKAPVSSISNGEDSVSSPPPAGFSTPSPSQNAGENGNGNHGDYDDDSNAAKNGDDFSFPATSEQDDNSVSCDGAALSNDVTSGSVVTNDDDNAMPVPEVSPAVTVVDDAPVNGGGAIEDRVVADVEEPVVEAAAAALPEIIIPATNGNGASVQENGATEIASEKVSETSNSSSPPPPSIQADDVVTSPKQLAAAVKRAATPEATEEAVEAEPATKKFKPEEPEQQPEAAAVVVATAVV